jgi:hypothetical protein
MLVSSSRVTATVGFELNVQTFEWSSLIAQSTSVSVNANSAFPAESKENVPLDPTCPPSGHASDPAMGRSATAAWAEATCRASATLPCGCPSEIPKRKERAPVIDCSCSVVSFSPGWVVESRLHEAVTDAATKTAHAAARVANFPNGIVLVGERRRAQPPPIYFLRGRDASSLH